MITNTSCMNCECFGLVYVERVGVEESTNDDLHEPA